MAWHVRIGLASALFLLLSVACDASDTKMERWAQKFAQPALEVTAEQLYREFSRDDETARNHYGGRRVLVTGQVHEVREDDDFEPVVEFDVGQDLYAFQTLLGEFAERHRSTVESWNSGDQISIVCYIPVEDFGAFSFESVTPLRMCQPLN